MKISSVSFGKTIKVYAPYHDAVRIANAANGAECVKPEVQNQVKEIFNDTEKGHALAFNFYDNSGVCYIFSGKESREYLHNLYQKTVLVKKIKSTEPLNSALPKVVEANQNFNKQTFELIERTKEDYSLKIAPNGESVEIIK